MTDAISVEGGPQSASGRTKWRILAAVGSAIFLGTLNGSVANIAVPTLVRELDTTIEQAHWGLLSFLLANAVLLVSMGKLGDAMGKKPVFAGGLVVSPVCRVHRRSPISRCHVHLRAHGLFRATQSTGGQGPEGDE